AIGLAHDIFVALRIGGRVLDRAADDAAQHGAAEGAESRADALAGRAAGDAADAAAGHGADRGLGADIDLAHPDHHGLVDLVGLLHGSAAVGVRRIAGTAAREPHADQ